MKNIFLVQKSGKQFYFVLLANNEECIATSEMYNTLQGCKDGIKAVKKVSKIAKVVIEKSRYIEFKSKYKGG